MSFPSIPLTLQEWNIETLDKLTAYRDIESDTFDFKGEINKLDEHLCAMANSGGGTLVLGIDEVKAPNGHLLSFKKTGFHKGQESVIDNQIGNHVFQIEPNPKVELKYLLDSNGKFYVVVRVLTEESKKPYMLKDRGQFYVRINGSSRPASRAIIFNLFSNTRQRKAEIETLRMAAKFLRESFLHMAEEFISLGAASTFKATPLDLSTIRNAVLSAQWFILENNIFGEVDERGGYTEGLTSIIYILERLNTNIHAYNLEDNESTKTRLLYYLKEWQRGHNNTNRIKEFLDKVIKLCSEALSKYP